MLERPEDVAEAVFAAKRRRREWLRNLPVEAKVEILVRLQQTASEVAANCGRPSRKPWRIPGGSPSASSPASF